MLDYIKGKYWDLRLGRACGQPWYSLRCSDGANIFLSILCDVRGHKCEKHNDVLSGGDWRIVNFKCSRCKGYLGALSVTLNESGGAIDYSWTHGTRDDCGCFFPNI